jgi:hypothetical protein
MQRRTLQRSDKCTSKGHGNFVAVRISFLSCWWFFIAAPAGGVLAAFLVIALSGPEAIRETKETASPATEPASRSTSGTFRGKSAETGDQSFILLEKSKEIKIKRQIDGKTIEMSEAEWEMSDAEWEEEKQRLRAASLEAAKAYKRAKEQFAADHPLVTPLSEHSRQASDAWKEQWYDVIRRNREFFDANARALSTVRDRNYEATEALAILELAKFQEPIGPDILGEAASHVIDNPKLFNALKQRLQDAVGEQLNDPALTAQIENASNRQSLAEVASRAASALRAANFNNLSQVTTDPEWQAVFDEEVWVRAVDWIQREYRHSFPSNVGEIGRRLDAADQEYAIARAKAYYAAKARAVSQD